MPTSSHSVSSDSVTLDAQTARKIREYLQMEHSVSKSLDHHPSWLDAYDNWIAALAPAPRTVPDGPFDEYFDGVNIANE